MRIYLWQSVDYLLAATWMGVWIDRIFFHQLQITPNDPLPKTICETCMNRVEQHHELMIKMEKHRSFFAAQTARAQLIRSGEARNSSAATNRTETITSRQTRTATPTVTVTSSSVTTPSTDRISPNRNTVDSNTMSTSTIVIDGNEDEDESTAASERTDTCERGSNSNNNNDSNRHSAALAEDILI